MELLTSRPHSSESELNVPQKTEETNTTTDTSDANMPF